MRILLTGSTSRLGAVLARELDEHHEVRTMDLSPSADGPAPTFVGDPRDRELAEQATAGCDVVIHLLAGPADRGPSLLPEGPDDTPQEVIDAAARGTYNLFTTSAAPRFILISTLRHFESYPAHWAVGEEWMPRPTTDTWDLAPFLAEVVVREASRDLPARAIILRLGEVVEDAVAGNGDPDPRRLHLEDAVQAVERAMVFEPAAPAPPSGLWIFHIVGGGKNTRFQLVAAAEPSFGYAPGHDLTGGRPLPTAPDELVRPQRDSPADRAIRRVVVYGANGPFGAIAAEVLEPDHILRLTSRRPMADVIAADEPQNPGAPMPRLLDPPHEVSVVDITDPTQVLAAAEGMDAILNCTVIRPDPVEAFRVNMLGAYNLALAALECGIKRLVHTGPQQHFTHERSYEHDFSIPDEAPPRPGTHLYSISKLLGQEILRIFAEEYGMEVPALLWGQLQNHELAAPQPGGGCPFTTSWYDTGQAMRLAITAPSFPRPFEVINVVADLPQGKMWNEKAERLLGWRPRYRLNRIWTRSSE